jgi:hypothetical protein
MKLNRRDFLSNGVVVPTAVFAGAVAPGFAAAATHDRSAEASEAQCREFRHESSGFSRVNGYKLFHVTLGRGMPVIFMHGGLGFDHQYFRPFVDPLSRSAKVVYYDHLGHGRSDRPASFNEMPWPA